MLCTCWTITNIYYKLEGVGPVDNRPSTDIILKLLLTKHKYRILIGFQKSPNTKYRILLGNEKIRIPNAYYYLVLRKSEYPIQIVQFDLTIQILNNKFLIVYKILEKTQLESTYLSHTRSFALKICETIQTDIPTSIPIPKYYFGGNSCRSGTGPIFIPNIVKSLLSVFVFRFKVVIAYLHSVY